MSRRRRYSIETKKNSTFTLNITSMTDMFTLLLVFLLQSYNTSEVQLEPVQNLRLPSSNTSLNPANGLQLKVSKDSLLIEDRKIAQISNLQIEEKDLDPKDSNFILPLFAELDKTMKDPKAKSVIKDGRILLQADAALPYSTVRKILYTASMAGFPQLKLVTTVGN